MVEIIGFISSGAIPATVFLFFWFSAKIKELKEDFEDIRVEKLDCKHFHDGKNAIIEHDLIVVENNVNELKIQLVKMDAKIDQILVIMKMKDEFQSKLDHLKG